MKKPAQKQDADAPTTAEKRRRGRPEHKPTKRMREQVMLRKAAGWSLDRIAEEIGLKDEDTLKKHYGAELASGWSRKRGEVLDMLFKVAKKGNVTAQKTLVSIIDAAAPIGELSGDAPIAETPVVEVPKKAGYVTKKSIAEEEAKTAGLGTEWEKDLQIGPVGPLPN